MAIKKYTFDYDSGDASAEFEVDTEIFTPEVANVTLTFFSWLYDEEGDPVDEVLKKYAEKAIWFATRNNRTVKGVIADFEEDAEGFARVDGSLGIKLIAVYGLEIIDNRLEMEVTYDN